LNCFLEEKNPPEARSIQVILSVSIFFTANWFHLGPPSSTSRIQFDRRSSNGQTRRARSRTLAHTKRDTRGQRRDCGRTAQKPLDTLAKESTFLAAVIIFFFYFPTSPHWNRRTTTPSTDSGSKSLVSAVCVCVCVCCADVVFAQEGGSRSLSLCPLAPAQSKRK
jgi:hypothetical protein